jgi:hypothetical protein
MWSFRAVYDPVWMVIAQPLARRPRAVRGPSTKQTESSNMRGAVQALKWILLGA